MAASRTRKGRPARRTPPKQAVSKSKTAKKSGKNVRPTSKRAKPPEPTRAAGKRVKPRLAARAHVRAKAKTGKRPPPAARPATPSAGKRTAVARPGAPRPVTLNRARRQLSDRERMDALDAPRETSTPVEPDNGSRPDSRMMASVRSGAKELRAMLERNTQSSPTLTAGDVDAKWEDAYAIGDEAPGGDNPTPDQDRVDDIGKALGIRYRDDEVLQGGDEITARDRHRWELDPASSDDWPHGESEKDEGEKDED
jgi:hypothetical protein